MSRKEKAKRQRIGGQFVAMPMSVLTCTAFVNLSHPAKALLIEIAMQYSGGNNGSLLVTDALLSKRGWKSHDVIDRAKQKLIDGGFLFETFKGHRPNKASWYALTWWDLDRIDGYDQGVMKLFKRRAYEDAPSVCLKVKPDRESLYLRHRESGIKNEVLNPSGGVGEHSIAPSPGVESISSTPSPGPIRANFEYLSTPSPGDLIYIPSVPCAFLGSRFRQRLPIRHPVTLI